MTTRLPALALMMLLGTVAVAEAQGPERQLTVFVTAALDGAGQGETKDAASPKDLIGTVVDVKNAITGSGLRGRRKHLVLVGSAAEAQLIVEIRGRRSSYGPGLFGRNYTVLFAIKPRPDAPERVMEASGKGSWKVAGAVVASMVDEFARDHADAVAALQSPPCSWAICSTCHCADAPTPSA
jgi:hypothetical protein